MARPRGRTRWVLAWITLLALAWAVYWIFDWAADQGPSLAASH